MMMYKIVFILSILLFFSGCERVFKNYISCDVEELEKKLTKDEKKTLYKNIQKEIEQLLDKADTCYAKTYYLEAVQSYELVNFYMGKEFIPKTIINKIKVRINANGKYYYEKASNTPKDKKLQKLFYLNELMKNTPEYKDSEILFMKLRRDEDVKKFLEKDKEKLAKILQQNNKLENENYIADLNEAIDKIAKYDDADPLVVEAKGILQKARYNLRQSAINLYKLRKFDRAKKKFQAIYEVYKKDRISNEYLQLIELNHELVKMQQQLESTLKRSNYIEAIKIANKILMLDPNNIKVEEKKELIIKNIPKVFELAKSYYNKQEYTKALAIFEEVLKLDRDNKTSLTYIKKIKAQLKTIKSLK
jgi:hypothetical protein